MRKLDADDLRFVLKILSYGIQPIEMVRAKIFPEKYDLLHDPGHMIRQEGLARLRTAQGSQYRGNRDELKF